MPAWADKITTTLFGRRLGLQLMSSSVTGSKQREYVVGPDGVRASVTTAETTSTNLAPDGVSNLNAVSSGVYTLDPPIPGVAKYIAFGSTTVTSYVKTANGETFLSSQGTTFSVMKSTQLVAGMITLVGQTTATWLLPTGISTATMALSTST